MVVVYDIEVLKNYFLYVDCDIETGEFHEYEISFAINELEPLLKHLKGLKAQIGFNNLGYDAQIIQHIRKNAGKFRKLEWDELTDVIHDYSNYVIGAKDENRWPDYREQDIEIIQIDLFKVWHYDNAARHCSLKYLQYSMDWHNIEDMPIDHRDLVLEDSVREDIRSYCRNDVLSTKEFYNITRGQTALKLYKGIDKIQLRKDIQKKFGFRCINYSDVKIGDEINKTNYMKATGKTWKEIKELRAKRGKFTFGDCYPEYMEFQSEELRGFFDRIKNIYIDVNSMQDFVIKFGGVEYTMAKGGLHSKDKPRKIIPRQGYILRDADVGSMYPNAIRKRKLYPKHLGIEWLEGYGAIIQERLRSKKLFKETKDTSYQSIVEAYKLALNGGSFGKTGDPSNWQYDPFITFAVTIGCQIDLLMFIEDLTLNNIRVISANTDGVLCLFKKEQEETYKEICTRWEKKVGNYGKDNGELEYADYSLFAQMSVNSYIALGTDGKVKQKDEFVVDTELHKNKSNRIVRLALQAYYTKGIHPVKFIYEHDNIMDFCAVVRGKGSWCFETRSVVNGEYVVHSLPKTNRFYISNGGAKLVKVNKDDNREIQVDAGKWLCTIYNKHEPKAIKDYNINYDFYIEQVYNIISTIEPEIVSPYSQQLSLFV